MEFQTVNTFVTTSWNTTPAILFLAIIVKAQRRSSKNISIISYFESLDPHGGWVHSLATACTRAVPPHFIVSCDGMTVRPDSYSANAWTEGVSLKGGRCC